MMKMVMAVTEKGTDFLKAPKADSVPRSTLNDYVKITNEVEKFWTIQTGKEVCFVARNLKLICQLLLANGKNDILAFLHKTNKGRRFKFN
jgi:hypothetical protein